VDEVRIIGEVRNVQVIAAGASVRDRRRLRRQYGRGRWRKMKGEATIETPKGQIREAEVHWYEAHGIGRVDWKAKRYID
jgi:hypothetical protein